MCQVLRLLQGETRAHFKCVKSVKHSAILCWKLDDWYQVLKMIRFSSKIHPSVLINRDLRGTNGPLQSDAFFVGGAERLLKVICELIGTFL
jgi:hypothetical protein